MRTLVATLIGGLLLIGSTVAFADDEVKVPYTFSGGVTYSTDYMYRGQSQTGNNPAVSGTLNFAYDTGMGANIYAGTWASSINFGGDMELDWYGGLNGTLGDTGLGWEAGFLYYQYPGGADSANLDFVEGHLGLSYAFADLPGSPTVGFKVHMSPDWQLKSDTSVYYEGNVAFTLPYEFGLAVHVAHQSVKDNVTWGSPDWTEWNVYLSRHLIGPISASVGYQDTNLNRAECFGGTNICDGRAVLNLTASF